MVVLPLHSCGALLGALEALAPALQFSVVTRFFLPPESLSGEGTPTARSRSRDELGAVSDVDRSRVPESERDSPAPFGASKLRPLLAFVLSRGSFLLYFLSPSLSLLTSFSFFSLSRRGESVRSTCEPEREEEDFSFRTGLAGAE